MNHQLLGMNRFQMQMTSLEACITKGNPVRLIDAFVEKLSLKELSIVIDRKNNTIKGGRPSYPPAVFLKLYLYGYLNKIRSSRKLEQECHRNVELHWLLQYLTPNYHTIADFRKDNTKALKMLFRLYVSFMEEMKLLGKETVGIDGTKLRAVNSSKNNYNQKKIDKHQQLIAEKATAYLNEMDILDKADENEIAQHYRQEEVQAALQSLNERVIKYDSLEQALARSDEKQISTTDADSRALIINKNIVEVAYNTQCVIDAKHNLIVHCQATNSNDTQALYETAMHAKENLGLKQEDSIDVLADKGYHNGKQLHNCGLQNIVTYTAYREQPAVKHLEKEFLVAQFVFDKEADNYTCPAGEKLTTTGTWHDKKRDAGDTSYRFQKYTTVACTGCKLQAQCTKLKYRAIERSEYQEAVDKNNLRIKENKDYYRKRQSICEHPFGTIKRGWGYTFTLLKGLEKVDGEMNLIMLCYNIKRTISILGFDALSQAINKWQPNYKKVLYTIKILVFKCIVRLNKQLQFVMNENASFLQLTALSS